MAKNTIDFSVTNPENAPLAGNQAPQAEETPEDAALEVAVGPEPEAKAEVVTLTPEQFAELKASGDSAKAVKEGIDALASKLSAPQAVAVAPVNAPQKTFEEIFEEVSDDLYDKTKGAGAFRKLAKMVGEQEYGPVVTGLSTELAATKKKLLLNEDPYFKKYLSEVDSLIAQQQPAVRNQANIYDLAWAEVRKRHASEIEDDTVTKKVDAGIAAKLKELGIDPSKPVVAGRPAAHTGGEGRSTPTVTTSPGAKRTLRVPDAAARAKLENDAARKGVDIETLAKTRGFMPW